MPMRVVTLELKHRDSPRLAKILTKWVWTKSMTFRYLLSTTKNKTVLEYIQSNFFLKLDVLQHFWVTGRHINF